MRCRPTEERVASRASERRLDVVVRCGSCNGRVAFHRFIVANAQPDRLRERLVARHRVQAVVRQVGRVCGPCSEHEQLVALGFIGARQADSLAHREVARKRALRGRVCGGDLFDRGRLRRHGAADVTHLPAIECGIRRSGCSYGRIRPLQVLEHAFRIRRTVRVAAPRAVCNVRCDAFRKRRRFGRQVEVDLVRLFLDDRCERDGRLVSLVHKPACFHRCPEARRARLPVWGIYRVRLAQIALHAGIARVRGRNSIVSIAHRPRNGLAELHAGEHGLALFARQRVALVARAVRDSRCLQFEVGRERVVAARHAHFAWIADRTLFRGIVAHVIRPVRERVLVAIDIGLDRAINRRRHGGIDSRARHAALGRGGKRVVVHQLGDRGHGRRNDEDVGAGSRNRLVSARPNGNRAVFDVARAVIGRSIGGGVYCRVDRVLHHALRRGPLAGEDDISLQRKATAGIGVIRGVQVGYGSAFDLPTREHLVLVVGRCSRNLERVAVFHRAGARKRSRRRRIACPRVRVAHVDQVVEQDEPVAGSRIAHLDGRNGRDVIHRRIPVDGVRSLSVCAKGGRRHSAQVRRTARNGLAAVHEVGIEVADLLIVLLDRIANIRLVPRVRVSLIGHYGKGVSWQRIPRASRRITG